MRDHAKSYPSFFKFQNIVYSVNTVLDGKYMDHWLRIKKITNEPVDRLVALIEKYLMVLSMSQHDTYTSPFEIVSPNMGKYGN